MMTTTPDIRIRAQMNGGCGGSEWMIFQLLMDV
jgi:hypothetical protein